ncbi:type I restriction endonuclease subunit R [Metabacillus hrfriensis]|uniref:Type I restriction endonuclease subunit R n=1 Tax=Metabacillus hrfriensis TaxID=3048891 RepID=A0ACD4RE51_9BACI|nr:type I restriction endonuclease subunit R [Metabacillus sp. CT-WN-B3]WHZ58781.1 type I restriction endonuclease subunit R [Metabacillus sp. CT-WN-B3]
MAKIITEDMLEKAMLDVLTSPKLSYSHMNCFTIDPDDLNDGTNRENKKQVILYKILLQQLKKINPHIPIDILKNLANDQVTSRLSIDLMKVNYYNYNKIRNEIKVEYQKNGKKEIGYVKLIDFNCIYNNDFTVCSQMWIKGETYYRRPDLIIFINGLPIVFIELKNSDIKVKNAYDKNLKDYLRDIPQLFYFNQICVLSNARETRLGSFNAEYEYFFEWLKFEEKETPDRKKIKSDGVSLLYLAEGLLLKENLLDYIENFILFDRKQSKLIAKNHQYLGVNNAVKAFENRENLNGKLGVFWHTQGSGKSYSMVMFTRKINRKFKGNFTFLIITDRDDLDGQIYKNYLRTGVISKDEKVRPKNSSQLREYLQMNKTYIFSLIHKFRYDKGKKYPVLSERDDIIVIVDEAHRTQYKELAENMRAGLINAQYIAFTGTPLLGNKRLTNAWFGDYISEYNFGQSIEDGATVPLFYSKRVPTVDLINIDLDNDFADIIESEDLSEEEQKRLEKHYSHELEVLKRDDRLEAVAKDIVYHFPRRGYLGKGMVVSVDKFTAVKIYDKVQYHWNEEIKRLNKEIKKESDEIKKATLKNIVDYMRSVKMAVVISQEDGEEEKFAKQGLNIKIHRDRMNSVDENGFDIEDHFKNPQHKLSLVFVCSMWLTGFDVPSVSTIYLDKPMRGHTLMQAIARANRVAPGKTSGIVVDYLNIFKYMKKALGEYADSKDDIEMPVKDMNNLIELINQTLNETEEFCSYIGIDLKAIIDADNTFEMLELFMDYANVILGNDDNKNQFRVYSNLAENLYEASKPEIFSTQWDNPLLKVILYLRGIIDGTVSDERIENAKTKISVLLDQSIEAARVEGASGEYGIVKSKVIDLSKLDIDKIREQFKVTPYKNIEISDLRVFIEEKLNAMLNKNVTRSKFSELFKGIIDRYNAGGSENEEFYEELLKFIEKMHEEDERHIRENLKEEELELFDLLKKDKLTKKEEQQVKLSAKELFETLVEKKNGLLIVDWYKDEQPKLRVQSVVQDVLDKTLPQSYDRLIFKQKLDVVFNHIVDRATTGYNYVAM